jgi:hypothetical protein
MNALNDADLYLRDTATLVASWQEYARVTANASFVTAPGVAIAVFPSEPERSIYNNALLDRDLDASERVDAIETIETTYRDAGVSRFAAWVHESDRPMRSDLERSGYTVVDSSRAMGMTLDDIRLPRPEVDIARADWSEHARVGELPPGLLADGEQIAFHILVARLEGENVATGISFDLADDCGIYNVGTLEYARRRGLGTAITLAHLYDARDRGCSTASLQSTPMAERVYASTGFRDLGLFLEYAPPPSRATASSAVES